MSNRLLHTVVFASSVANGTRKDSEAGAAIHVKPGARVTFAIVGAPGVNASVLATSIVDLAFINILTCFSIFVQFLSRRTPAVETSNGVTAESFTASIGLLTFIHIVLTAGAAEPCGTITELGGSFPTLAPVEANTVATHRIKTARLSV